VARQVLVGAILKQFDPKYLDDMSGGDTEFVHDIISTFLETAHELVDGLTLAADQDPQRAVYLAHTLKGSARSVGANPLGDLCEDLEKLAGSGDMPGYKLLVSKVPETFTQLSEELAVVLQPKAA